MGNTQHHDQATVILGAAVTASTKYLFTGKQGGEGYSGRSGPAHQLRQIGEVRRHPPRLVIRQVLELPQFGLLWWQRRMGLMTAPFALYAESDALPS